MLCRCFVHHCSATEYSLSNQIKSSSSSIWNAEFRNWSSDVCVLRCAAVPPPIHRPEGIILHGLLYVRHGHQPDRPLPQHHRHAHPLQRVRRHVQHALHHPVQPDSRVSARGRGTREKCFSGSRCQQRHLCYKMWKGECLPFYFFFKVYSEILKCAAASVSLEFSPQQWVSINLLSTGALSGHPPASDLPRWKPPRTEITLTLNVNNGKLTLCFKWLSYNKENIVFNLPSEKKKKKIAPHPAVLRLNLHTAQNQLKLPNRRTDEWSTTLNRAKHSHGLFHRRSVISLKCETEAEITRKNSPHSYKWHFSTVCMGWVGLVVKAQMTFVCEIGLKMDFN